MRFLSAILVLSFVASGAAIAIAADTNAPPAAAPAAPAAKEKRICRRGEPTGSRLSVRTCHSEAEWAQIDAEQRAHAEREVDRAQAMSRGGGSGFNPN